MKSFGRGWRPSGFRDAAETPEDLAGTWKDVAKDAADATETRRDARDVAGTRDAPETAPGRGRLPADAARTRAGTPGTPTPGRGRDATDVGRDAPGTHAGRGRDSAGTRTDAAGDAGRRTRPGTGPGRARDPGRTRGTRLPGRGRDAAERGRDRRRTEQRTPGPRVA